MKGDAGFSAILARGFSPLRPLSPDTVSGLLRHYELLVRWNKSLNLTSISGLEEAVLRHYCESLFLGIHLPAPPVSVLDVGSGAGFPGIPMAILRPDCRFTLAESHQRKAVFLREATRHLTNVRIASCRAEEVEGPFDWVVSRAVKWSEVLKVAQGGAAPLSGSVRSGVCPPAGSASTGPDAVSASAGLSPALPSGTTDPGFGPSSITSLPSPVPVSGTTDPGFGPPSATTLPGPSVGLLLGQDDATDVVRQPLFAWRQPIPLPWGHRRVLVLGQSHPAG